MTHFLITTSENNITRLNFTHSFRAITSIYCGATCSLSPKMVHSKYDNENLCLLHTDHFLDKTVKTQSQD